jgi:membrane-associated phospholipid phosphatase
MKKKFSYLTSADAITIVFVSIFSIVEIVFSQRINNWFGYVLLNIFFIGGIFLCAQYVYTTKEKANRFIRIIRDWYLFPAIFFIYTQTSSMGHSIHQRDYDNILIGLDRWLFGTDPTVWITQFANPIITEILQLAYSSYYLFFVALFLEYYRRENLSDFHSGAMIVVYGFYLSYVGYLFFPAVGPRFTLHNFLTLNDELPGVFLTPYLREMINSGGGVVTGVSNVLETAHRDAFPSGHTQLTLTAIYLAFTLHSYHRWWLLVVGSLLIISTVYMRYHYTIDVLAGIGFFFITIWSGKKIDRWWKSYITKG